MSGRFISGVPGSLVDDRNDHVVDRRLLRKDRVALDLQALTSCSVDGLDVLINIDVRVHQCNRRLHVFVPHVRLHYLLTSTGRTDLFVLHPALDDAITATSTDQANNL